MTEPIQQRNDQPKSGDEPQRSPAVLRWAGAALMLAVIVGVVVANALRLERAHERRLARTDALAEIALARTAERFGDVDLLRSSEASKLRTYRNEEHVARAERLGVSGLADREAAEKYTQDGTLVELQDNVYFSIQKLDYSIPFVTRHTAHLLELLGMRFHEALEEAGLPPYRYVISSGTRTREDQEALRQVNVNAAGKSSHEFGTTVDIHYEKFDFAGEPDVMPDSSDVYHDVLNDAVAEGYDELAHTRQQKLKAILGRVLLDLQAEGHVLAIYERRQPVYHITVGGRIPDPAPQIGPASDDAVTAEAL